MTDTLAVFKQLTGAGMPEAQAEIIASAIWGAQRSLPPRPDAAIGRTRSGFWNWYFEHSSRHPIVNGALTGLALASVEAAIVWVFFGGLFARLCALR